MEEHYITIFWKLITIQHLLGYYSIYSWQYRIVFCFTKNGESQI